MAAIQLQCKIFPFAFLLYFCKPRFSINGSPEQLCAWGENTIPIQPGRYHLRVWYRYVTGPANVGEVVVDVPEGAGARVVYKTRWNVFVKGIMEVHGPAYGQPAGYGQPAPAAAAAHPPGWAPDPSGRHQHRWWDGGAWTPSVADQGVTSHDPL